MLQTVAFDFEIVKLLAYIIDNFNFCFRNALSFVCLFDWLFFIIIIIYIIVVIIIIILFVNFPKYENLCYTANWLLTGRDFRF